MTGIHQLLFSSFAATGGGVDTSVHTFNSDDTLAIGAATKLNWLLVAGGGGGAGGVSGSDNGGGGGAGGFRRGQNTPITGDLHIDVARDITLYADGGDWNFNDGTDSILKINNSGYYTKFLKKG